MPKDIGGNLQQRGPGGGQQRGPGGGSLRGGKRLRNIERSARDKGRKKGEGKPSSSGKGGKGGKGGGNFSNYKDDPLRKDIEGKISGQISGLLSGEIGSFTDEKVALLKQQVQQTARSEEKRLMRDSNRDLIRRGIFRSGIAASANRKIGMATQRTVSKAYNEIRMKQIEAEYSDKMQALQMGQKWLDGLRSYEIGKEQIAATREATAARTALGYAGIAAGERNAKRAAGAARASLGLGYAQLELSREKFEHQKGMDVAGVLEASGNPVPTG